MGKSSVWGPVEVPGQLRVLAPCDTSSHQSLLAVVDDDVIDKLYLLTSLLIIVVKQDLKMF